MDRCEDRFLRTSNVAQFLAWPSSVEVGAEELFHQGDLVEAMGKFLPWAARTILARSRFARLAQRTGPIARSGRWSAGAYGQKDHIDFPPEHVLMKVPTWPVGPNVPVIRK